MRASRRTPASRPFRPTGATSITRRTSRPGALFEYNKDPNGAIFTILRRDLQTGRERPFVNSPGRLGDAATVARRQAARVHPARPHGEPLFVKDLATGDRTAGVRQARQRPAGSLDGARRLPAVRLDARQPHASSSGARERSGTWTSRRSRAWRSRSSRRCSRRSRRRSGSRCPSIRTSSRSGMLRDVSVSPDGSHGRRSARSAGCYTRAPADRRAAAAVAGAHDRDGRALRARSGVVSATAGTSCTRRGTTAGSAA